MVVSQSDARFQCTHCDRSFKTNQYLKSHLNTHTGNRPHQCELCPRSFFYLQQLTHHINRHLGIKPYHCDQCDKSFVRLSELKTHQDQHNGKRRFKCSHCPKSFTQHPHLITHLRTHSGHRPFKCDQCPKQFSQSSHLSVHKQCSHSKNEKKYQCKICKVRFRLPHHLKSHLTTHSGERPFKCQKCPQAFNQVTCLTEHVKKWHGEDELPCQYCNKIFKTKLQRKAHESWHLKRERYFCVFCEKGFWKKHDLWRHLRGRHIKERIYKCGGCKKWFISSNGRNSCERSHEENKAEILNVKTVGVNKPEVEKTHGKGQAKDMREPPETMGEEVEHEVAEATQEQNGVEDIKTEQEEPEEINAQNNVTNTIMVDGEDDSLRCKICNMKMKSMWHRNAHMRTHKTKAKMEPVQCKVCNLMFRHQNQLNGHMNVHKVKVEPKEEGEESTAIPQIPAIRNNIKTNYRDLNNGPLYKIHTGRAVNDLDKKKQIKRKSDEELKPFQCRFCKKICKHHLHLNGHMRFHRELVAQERKNGIGNIKSKSPSQSPVKRTENYKGSYLSPIKVVSPIKIKTEYVAASPIKVRKELGYKCTKCPYSTKVKISLQLHVKLVHESVVPFKCDNCWKSFPTQTRLNEHLKHVHLHNSNLS